MVLQSHSDTNTVYHISLCSLKDQDGREECKRILESVTNYLVNQNNIRQCTAKTNETQTALLVPAISNTISVKDVLRLIEKGHCVSPPKVRVDMDDGLGCASNF